MTKSWRIDCIISGIARFDLDELFNSLVETAESYGAEVIGSVQEHEERDYVEEDSPTV